MGHNDPRALIDGWTASPLPVEARGVDELGGEDPLHQQFERDWWGSCANTFGEEAKQLTYAHRMGLVNAPQAGHWPVYDVGGARILDVGGGPASLLLKAINLRAGLVVDPCPYPDWTLARYAAAGVGVLRIPAEELTITGWDEVWLYNVLQHVRDPERVIRAARAAGRVLRAFEWVDFPPSIGHPHTLRAVELDAWLGVRGTVDEVHENGADGRAWYGAFG